jgi:hypothetical protein
MRCHHGRNAGTVAGEFGEVVSGYAYVLRPDHPVDEPDREPQALRILQDSGQPLRRAVRRHRRRHLQPATHGCFDLGGKGGELVETGRIVVSGDIGGGKHDPKSAR